MHAGTSPTAHSALDHHRDSIRRCDTSPQSLTRQISLFSEEEEGNGVRDGNQTFAVWCAGAEGVRGEGMPRVGCSQEHGIACRQTDVFSFFSCESVATPWAIDFCHVFHGLLFGASGLYVTVEYEIPNFRFETLLE